MSNSILQAEASGIDDVVKRQKDKEQTGEPYKDGKQKGRDAAEVRIFF